MIIVQYMSSKCSERGQFSEQKTEQCLDNFFYRADKAIDNMDIKFMVTDYVSFEKAETTIRYNSNAPRSAHYIKNIRYSNCYLNITVNDETTDYPLDAAVMAND
ncbi:unnamed protein product [Rhizophagus irregularis]|nr:unnamed protein product [Rhizophagus irregularis]